MIIDWRLARISDCLWFVSLLKIVQRSHIQTSQPISQPAGQKTYDWIYIGLSIEEICLQWLEPIKLLCLGRGWQTGFHYVDLGMFILSQIGIYSKFKAERHRYIYEHKYVRLPISTTTNVYVCISKTSERISIKHQFDNQQIQQINTDIGRYKCQYNFSA